jgi:acyl dehydratase
MNNFDQALEYLDERRGSTVTADIGRVSELFSQRFAVASSDLNPIYFDREAAEAAGYAALPLPPLLLSSVRGWEAGPTGADLLPDGTPVEDFEVPAELGLHVLGGGQELEFRTDLTTESVIHAEFRLDDAKLKQGRSGDLLVVTLSRTFYEKDGEIALRCTDTRLLR